MCDWGNTIDLIVTVPATLSYTGTTRRAIKGIDACLAPLVKALNDGGITTVSSCCGHGTGDGTILLSDGRELIACRKAPVNCLVEPPYPGAEDVVSFSIRYPDMTAHHQHPDCVIEWPHLIAECGIFKVKGGESS